jgi:uncharacterized protein (TIGR02268 family)
MGLPSGMGSARLPAPMMKWTVYRMQKAVLLALLTGATTAGAHPNPIQQKYSSVHRAFFLSKNPVSKVPTLYVAGGVVTVLRFEQPCDGKRTTLLGWEGRFEPVECAGKRVLLEPLHNLEPEDRFLLLVTLADGTELPFTVTASTTRRDMQVDIYPDPDTPEAVRVTLEETRKENKLLRAKVRRQEDEERWKNEMLNSTEYSLATLLAQDEISLTQLKELDNRVLRGEGVEILVSTLVPIDRMAKRKVAVVFEVTNKDPEKPWVLHSARIAALATDETKPFTAHGGPDQIAPGQTGRIALVYDLASFDPVKDGDKIVFELFRGNGERQSYIVWDTKNLSP